MSSDLPVVVYTSEPGLRSAKKMVKDLRNDLKASRELAWRLIIRDISAQYRQSLLGIIWAFLPPLVTALIFVVLNDRKIINLEETTIPYPVFAIFGTVLWQIFVYSLNAPLRVINTSRSLLTKINFPREALVLSSLGQTLFNAGIKLIILVAVGIVFNIPFTWGVPFALVATLSLIFLGITFGLLLTPLGLLYTDISHGLTIITTLWFFLTPVVYPSPAEFPFSLIATVNPVSPILIGVRDLATLGTLHNPIMFFVVTFLMILLFALSLIIYRLALPILIERLSA